MSTKRMSYRAEAREKLLRGATALTDALRVTLGPRSKCVLIEKKFGKPIVCNDGVTIAKELELQDVEENLGSRMLREAAERTGDAVGDGTTTATILAHAIFSEGLRNIAAGASAIDLKRGLDMALRVAVESIKSYSRPITGRKETAQIATISAHNDAALGELVADAMEKIGAEGVVSVEEAKGTETSLEVVEGMQFDRGFLSPYFITDLERAEAVIEDPVILLYEKKITNVKDLLPVLEQVAQQHAPLLIVADDVEGDALATLVVNKIRGILACIAVKAPGYGDHRKSLLQDMAVVTGGKFISGDLGVTLESLKLADLGRARRVVCDKDSTTIIGGHGSKEAISGRCQELRRLIEKTTSDYDKEKLQQRLAKLSGGVAVLRVGAPSEAEMKSMKEALDDAICATKAATAEGILPGGGLTLIRATQALEQAETAYEGDVKTGFRILRRALEAPTRQIAENSAIDGGVAIAQMKASQGNIGLDATTGKYVDLVEAGIIDPTKVVRLVLENAVSVAGTLLLTEATMTEVPEPKTKSPRHGDFPDE
jgi:chaperonin GroEL